MDDYLVDNLFQYDGLWHIADTSPIFPTGEGWLSALRTIANFPFPTKLYELEDIVGLKLLMNIPPSNIRSSKGDPYDEKYYHCAVWSDDLLELHNRNMLTGIVPVTEFEFQMNKYNSLIKAGFPEDENGDLIVMIQDPTSHKFIQSKIEKPRIEKYVSEFLAEAFDETIRDELIMEYEKDNKRFVLIPDSIELTQSGHDLLIQSSQSFDIPKEVEDRIRPLIDIQYYDTAIREVAILFEFKLKQFHNTDKFGDKLIGLHIDKCQEGNNGKLNAGIKVYRQELRTINKYIRNEFVHNLKSIDEAQFKAILFRQCTLYKYIDQALIFLSDNKVDLQ